MRFLLVASMLLFIQVVILGGAVLAAYLPHDDAETRLSLSLLFLGPSLLMLVPFIARSRRRNGLPPLAPLFWTSAAIALTVVCLLNFLLRYTRYAGLPFGIMPLGSMIVGFTRRARNVRRDG